MIEVEARTALPRLGAGQRTLVDEKDPTVRKWLRAGYLVPVKPPPKARAERSSNT